jgi:hypothetical protein
MRRALAAALFALPQPALAHGDHVSGSGVLHVLTSPEHLGVLLLAGAALALVHKLRASRHGRQPGRARNNTA